MADRKGALVIIGGHEDREGERVILREVARRLRGGRLVVATVASHEPEGRFDDYRRAFADLGVTDLTELHVHERAETLDGAKTAVLDGAAGVSPAATSSASRARWRHAGRAPRARDPRARRGWWPALR
jgi:cyanophycinase